jgi:hypothetical protein
MFTGFASENTPAVQVWNFFRDYTGTASISLSDDCAPIQLIKTGGFSSDILLYLPSAPIEGKRITIQNSMYGSSAQKIKLFSSDISGTGSNTLVFTIGSGCSLDLVYSKDFISSGVSSGTVVQTGWVTLNFSPRSSYSYNSAVIASDNSNAYEYGSVVLGGAGHVISAREAIVLGGSGNIVGGLRGSVLGGTNNYAQANYSMVSAGQSNTASGTNSVVIGGNNSTASSANSIILGGGYGFTRNIIGNCVIPANNSPIASSAGVSQSALLVLGVQTTNATATVLRSNTSAAGTTNQVILPDNSAYYFRGEVIAGVTGAGDTKGWYIEGVIKRGAGVGTTALVGTPSVTSLYADAGAATWTVALTANATLGGLAVTVTGVAATTIRWVCQIRTTEMTY